MIKYRVCLAEDAFEHLMHSDRAWESGDYLSVGVWGAVFLEAFLTDVIAKLDIGKGGHDDLNGKIQVLRNYSRNSPLEKVTVPDEIVKRADDIRNIRNRLVHDTGMKKNTLRQDAASIRGAIGVILDWYRQVSAPVAEENIENNRIQAEIKARVFLSSINPHATGQKLFLDVLKERLCEIGIEGVQVVSSIYDKKDPIGKICETMKGCDGTLIVGLERSHAYYLKEKEGGENESEEMHRRFTSGWLHLEGGIANALDHEVFIMCEKSIHSDGIFDRYWNSYPIIELESLDIESDPIKELLAHMKVWADRVNSAVE